MYSTMCRKHPKKKVTTFQGRSRTSCFSTFFCLYMFQLGHVAIMYRINPDVVVRIGRKIQSVIVLLYPYSLRGKERKVVLYYSVVGAVTGADRAGWKITPSLPISEPRETSCSYSQPLFRNQIKVSTN
jgi:hypothetical protein